MSLPHLWPRVRFRLLGRQREPGLCCRACGHRLDEATLPANCPECGADLMLRGSTFDNRPFNRRAIFLSGVATWTMVIAFCWLTMTGSLIERVNPREHRSVSIDLSLRPQRNLFEGFLTLIAMRTSGRQGDPDRDPIESITIRHWGAESPAEAFRIAGDFERDAFESWWFDGGFPTDSETAVAAKRELIQLLEQTHDLPYEAIWNEWVHRGNALSAWNPQGMSGATAPYRRRNLADWIFHAIWPAMWVVGFFTLLMVVRPSSQAQPTSRDMLSTPINTN